jgi:transposase InsO family protein
VDEVEWLAFLTRSAQCAAIRKRSSWITGPRSLGLRWPAALSDRKVRLHFIDPGKPTQSAYIESFIGRFRDECLNEHEFRSLAHARVITEDWRCDYNGFRPHKSLGNLTPQEFAGSLQTTTSLHFPRYNSGLHVIVESFNGKFCDEFLNDNVFTPIAEAREIIERWRIDYNECRPHRSLGRMTPSAFAIDQNGSLTTISL